MTLEQSEVEGSSIDAEEDKPSNTNLTGFVPFGYQCDVIRLIFNHAYSLYTPEILLSGSVGSAKSILLAHLAILHCRRWPGARVAIGRRALPDVKRTIFSEIVEHLEGALVEGVDYKKSEHKAEITFSNGSKIFPVTWGDRRYGKFRSLKLSMLIIEELTENDEEFAAGFKILKARLRRIKKVHENILITATNPGEPDSFWHDYFIEGSKQFASRYVFYSITTDNFHLDPIYVDQLLQDYSILEAERYLFGKWISLEGKGIYHAYAEARNFIDKVYKLDRTLPLRICFDFNTADGKPQSAALLQVDRKGNFHFFAESIIENANWCLDNLDEFESLYPSSDPGLVDKCIFHEVPSVIVHGDATGKARSSNSLRSNYDLIKDWLAQRKIVHKIEVPTINPPIVKRWTTVNALCQNAKKEVRLFVYKNCPTLNQGMKLTRKKEGTAVEDDSKKYQHVTTAIGYGICYLKANENRESKVINL